MLTKDYYNYEYYNFRFISLGVLEESQGCANLKHFIELNLAHILRVAFRTENDDIIGLYPVYP